MPRSNRHCKLYVDVRCGSVYTDQGVLPTGDRFIQNLKDYGPGLTHASDPRIMQVKGWSMHHKHAPPYNLSDGSLIYSESSDYCPILFLSRGMGGVAVVRRIRRCVMWAGWRPCVDAATSF